MIWNGLTPPYSTIVVDPPWHLGSINTQWESTSRGALPYTTMSLEVITSLPVVELAAPSAHLYLWAVVPFLRHSFKVAEAWGFEPKNILTWVKPGHGLGRRWRQNSEFVLFGERGPSLPIQRRDARTAHIWPRGAHSVKPAGFGDLVESVSPGPYVELFARSPRLGWDSWGYGWEQAAP